MFEKFYVLKFEYFMSPSHFRGAHQLPHKSTRSHFQRTEHLALLVYVFSFIIS